MFKLKRLKVINNSFTFAETYKVDNPSYPIANRVAPLNQYFEKEQGNKNNFDLPFGDHKYKLS